MNKTKSPTLPDMITVTNASIGFLSITYIIDERLWLASILIIICVALDGLDGFLARYLEVQHVLGSYLDFFSDIISFCFAPALLLYQTFYDAGLGRGWESPQNFLATFIPFIIVFLGTLRLARFADQRAGKKRFHGLPTPALALIVIHLSYLFGWRDEAIYSPYLVLLFLGMITSLVYTKLKYPKPRNKTFLLVGAIILIISFLGFLFHPFSCKYSISLLSITTISILGYVFISPIIVKINDREKK
ncbi:MAG: CDP-alcohol phosphatidyltransferase family protein [Thermoplasmata archaeon]